MARKKRASDIKDSDIPTSPPLAITPLQVLILVNAIPHNASARQVEEVRFPTPERSASLKLPSALCP